MIRTLSDKGIAALRKLEGLRLTAYPDGGGVLTIGYGHTGPDVYAGQAITFSKAIQLLENDVREAEDAVNYFVKAPLVPCQFDALVIFAFNIGVEAFKNSTLVKLLNSGDYFHEPDQAHRWIYDNGRVVGGLKTRREAEIKILGGDYPL